MEWHHKDLLDVTQLSKEEVQHVFETATYFQEINSRPVKKVPTLKGHSVVLFLPSQAPEPKSHSIWPGKGFPVTPSHLPKVQAV